MKFWMIILGCYTTLTYAQRVNTIKGSFKKIYKYNNLPYKEKRWFDEGLTCGIPITFIGDKDTIKTRSRTDRSFELNTKSEKGSLTFPFFKILEPLNIDFGTNKEIITR